MCFCVFFWVGSDKTHFIKTGIKLKQQLPIPPSRSHSLVKDEYSATIYIYICDAAEKYPNVKKKTSIRHTKQKNKIMKNAVGDDYKFSKIPIFNI